MNKLQAIKIKIGNILFNKKDDDKQLVLEVRKAVVKGRLTIYAKCKNLLDGQINEFEHKDIKYKESEFNESFLYENSDIKKESKEKEDKKIPISIKDKTKTLIEKDRKEKANDILEKEKNIIKESIKIPTETKSNKKEITKSEILIPVIVNNKIENKSSEFIKTNSINEIQKHEEIKDSIELQINDNILSKAEYNNCNFRFKRYINDYSDGSNVIAFVIDKVKGIYGFKPVETNKEYIIKATSLNNAKKLWNNSSFSIKSI